MTALASLSAVFRWKRQATALTLALGALTAWAQQPAPAQTVSTQAAPTGAANVTTSTGLIYTSLKEGSGASPQASDTVRVHYRGTFPDGKEFDSSYSRGQPAQFPLNRRPSPTANAAHREAPDRQPRRSTSRWSCWASWANDRQGGSTHALSVHDTRGQQGG